MTTTPTTMTNDTQNETDLLNAQMQTQAPGGEDGRPANLPEKFWDAERKCVRLQDLVNSYVALERRLSGSMPAPETPEDRLKVLRRLGLPETSDEYVVDVSHGMFQIDPALNRKLHERGFTSEQVQTVYDLAAEKLVPLILEMAGEFQADREVERLVAHFGGAEKWREVSRQLLAFGKKTLPPDVLKGLSSSYEGVLALYRMMNEERPRLAGNGEGEGAGDSVTDEKALQSMMRDPRYWKTKDPAFIAKVTDGFSRLYGG